MFRDRRPGSSRSSKLKASPGLPDYPRGVHDSDRLLGVRLIILGVILLIIGFIAHIAIVWTIGIIVLVAGLILALLGTIGHAVGGRRHYF